MATKELLIISQTAGLESALGGYESLTLIAGPNLDFALRQTTSRQPPAAIYAEDAKGTQAELWSLVKACQGAEIRLYVGLTTTGRPQAADLGDAGVAVLPAEARSADQIAAWLAQHEGVRQRPAARGQAVIAIGGAKGGVGKTTAAALIGEVLVRRGLRVLLVDGDVSNSGIVSAFRIPSGFSSYLQAKTDGPGAWNDPKRLRSYIYRDHPSRLHFLLGSEEVSNTSADLTLPEWQGMMRAVRSMPEYDVVLVDTGPEIKRRPYALLAVRDGGQVVFPVGPGRKERYGADNALYWFQHDDGVDLTDRCLLLFMEPEYGVKVTVQQVKPDFMHKYPRATILGTLGRAPRILSEADEVPDRYVSALDIAPHSKFVRTVYGVANQLCQAVGVTPPLPTPRSGWWQRFRGDAALRTPEQIAKQPALVPVR